MKSILKYGVLLLLCSMLLCACGKQNGVDTPVGTEPVVMDSEIKTVSIKDVIQFQCAEDDVLYGIDKEQKRILRFPAEDGAVGEILTEGEFIQCLCYGNGKIYYTASNKLYELNPISKAVKELATFEGDTFNYVKMVKVKDSIFILRREMYEEAQSAVRFDESDEYQYLGECLEVFHLQSGTLKTVPISNIKCITDKSDNELLFYAYDGEGGFYFSTYQVEEESFTEKLYRGKKVRNVQDIAYDKVLKIAFYADMEGIKALSGETLSKSTLVYEGSGLSSLQCRESITYALQRSGTDAVIRLVNTSLNLDAPVLKAYTTQTLGPEGNPSSLKFQIELEHITGGELTTKILAGDSDYDFLVLNSGWDLGYHLLRTGNYISMNDIDGVEDFLDECHDFAKDAATREDGTIWMLPYKATGGLFFYNEVLLQKMGLTPEDIDTVEEVFALAEEVMQENTAYVDLAVTHLYKALLADYAMNYGMKDETVNYNTDKFRKVLDIEKRYVVGTDGSEKLYRTIPNCHVTEENEEKIREIFENTLFRMERTEHVTGIGQEWQEFDYWRAIPMPGLEEEKQSKNQMGLYYIVINPNSDKLPWIKQYVEKLCQSIREDTESFLIKANTFPDNPLFNEIMDVLADSQVNDFLYPDDIISDAAYKYLYEDQSFEDTAEEIERVINMYLNE